MKPEKRPGVQSDRQAGIQGWFPAERAAHGPSRNPEPQRASGLELPKYIKLHSGGLLQLDLQ